MGGAHATDAGWNLLLPTPFIHSANILLCWPRGPAPAVTTLVNGRGTCNSAPWQSLGDGRRVQGQPSVCSAQVPRIPLSGGPTGWVRTAASPFPDVSRTGVGSVLQPSLELEVFISPSLQEQLIDHWDLGRGFLIKMIGKPLIVGQALS